MILLTKKKDKPINVNQKSLKNIQNKLDKLRPIKEEIARRLNDVDGFVNIILGTKIQIIALDKKAKQAIQKLLTTKHKRVSEVINIDDEIKERQNKKSKTQAYGGKKRDKK